MSSLRDNKNSYNMYSIPQFQSATDGKCLKTIIRDYEPRKSANVRSTMRTFDSSIYNVHKYNVTIPFRISVTPKYCS